MTSAFQYRIVCTVFAEFVSADASNIAIAKQLQLDKTHFRTKIVDITRLWKSHRISCTFYAIDKLQSSLHLWSCTF